MWICGTDCLLCLFAVKSNIRQKMILTDYLLQKLNKPGLWFVCSEHPASELIKYVYDFAVELGVPVVVNIENGIAAIALAQISGATKEEIKEAMASFQGVDRRFDFRIRTDKIVYLSDYAHHPAEIRQSILSIKQLYEGKRIKAIFQPHLYTRTRDFYMDFADSLSLLDDVAIVDIYPAREKPIPGVTSALIYNNLRPGTQKQMCTKDEICDIVRQGVFDVLVTLGAGDIEDYADKITEILRSQA